MDTQMYTDCPDQTLLSAWPLHGSAWLRMPLHAHFQQTHAKAARLIILANQSPQQMRLLLEAWLWALPDGARGARPDAATWRPVGVVHQADRRLAGPYDCAFASQAYPSQLRWYQAEKIDA